METVLNRVKKVISTVLEVEESSLDSQTELIGVLPELDSLSVAEIMAALEAEFGFKIDYDDISAEEFETVETLEEYVERRINE